MDKHSDKKFDRLAADLEAFDAIQEKRELHAEEQELQAILAHLRTEYEDRSVARPTSPPLDVLSGQRGISKAHARRLAVRFHLSVEAFI